jgi:hypothetical protein
MRTATARAVIQTRFITPATNKSAISAQQQNPLSENVFPEVLRQH